MPQTVAAEVAKVVFGNAKKLSQEEFEARILQLIDDIESGRSELADVSAEKEQTFAELEAILNGFGIGLNPDNPETATTEQIEAVNSAWNQFLERLTKENPYAAERMQREEARFAQQIKASEQDEIVEIPKDKKAFLEVLGKFNEEELKEIFGEKSFADGDKFEFASEIFGVASFAKSLVKMLRGTHLNWTDYTGIVLGNLGKAMAKPNEVMHETGNSIKSFGIMMLWTSMTKGLHFKNIDFRKYSLEELNHLIIYLGVTLAPFFATLGASTALAELASTLRDELKRRLDEGLITERKYDELISNLITHVPNAGGFWGAGDFPWMHSVNTHGLDGFIWQFKATMQMQFIEILYMQWKTAEGENKERIKNAIKSLKGSNWKAYFEVLKQFRVSLNPLKQDIENLFGLLQRKKKDGNERLSEVVSEIFNDETLSKLLSSNGNEETIMESEMTDFYQSLFDRVRHQIQIELTKAQNEEIITMQEYNDAVEKLESIDIFAEIEKNFELNEEVRAALNAGNPKKAVDLINTFIYKNREQFPLLMIDFPTFSKERKKQHNEIPSLHRIFTKIIHSEDLDKKEKSILEKSWKKTGPVAFEDLSSILRGLEIEKHFTLEKLINKLTGMASQSSDGNGKTTKDEAFEETFGKNFSHQNFLPPEQFDKFLHKVFGSENLGSVFSGNEFDIQKIRHSAEHGDFKEIADYLSEMLFSPDKVTKILQEMGIDSENIGKNKINVANFEAFLKKEFGHVIAEAVVVLPIQMGVIPMLKAFLQRELREIKNPYLRYTYACLLTVVISALAENYTGFVVGSSLAAPDVQVILSILAGALSYISDLAPISALTGGVPELGPRGDGLKYSMKNIKNVAPLMMLAYLKGSSDIFFQNDAGKSDLMNGIKTLKGILLGSPSEGNEKFLHPEGGISVESIEGAHEKYKKLEELSQRESQLTQHLMELLNKLESMYPKVNNPEIQKNAQRTLVI